MSQEIPTDKIAGKIKDFSADRKLRYGNKILDLNRPVVMGILNLTPDSFYAASRLDSQEAIIESAGKMISEGAAILDLGAMSTRPGAGFVSENEEIDRLIRPLENLQKQFPETWFSVDTYRASVAKIAIENGASIINDISGGTFDEAMFPLIGSKNIPYVLMHIAGQQHDMHQHKISSHEVVKVVHQFFKTQLEKLGTLNTNQIILDPGFGFSKTLAANYRLISEIQHISPGGFPILVGVSRKRMIQNVLQLKSEESLNGTTVLNTLALENGASILRVHDVKEADECVRLWNFYREASESEIE
ncbi:MAG: dihydropteroate synthase [Bacteroidales bacterium]|nr:dihydropteroate synthase [Bacteroidales bacterium]